MKKEVSVVDAEKTVVMFRKFEDGEVIALFPEIKEFGRGVDCLSYAQIGQHGGAHYSHVVSITSLAKEAEYRELAAELESLGYNLDIRKRRTFKV